jgi:hypothetical protein
MLLYKFGLDSSRPLSRFARKSGGKVVLGATLFFFSHTSYFFTKKQRCPDRFIQSSSFEHSEKQPVNRKTEFVH